MLCSQADLINEPSSVGYLHAALVYRETFLEEVVNLLLIMPGVVNEPTKEFFCGGAQGCKID